MKWMVVAIRKAENATNISVSDELKEVVTSFYIILYVKFTCPFTNLKGCSDSYPKNYWSKCTDNCGRLKKSNKCWKKWGQAVNKRCRMALSPWMRNQKVSQSCRKTCNLCGKKLYFFTNVFNKV